MKVKSLSESREAPDQLQAQTLALGALLTICARLHHTEILNNGLDRAQLVNVTVTSRPFVDRELFQASCALTKFSLQGEGVQLVEIDERGNQRQVLEHLRTLASQDGGLIVGFRDLMNVVDVQEIEVALAGIDVDPHVLE